MERRLGGRYLPNRLAAAKNKKNKRSQSPENDPLRADDPQGGSLLSSINEKIHNKYEIKEWLQDVEDGFSESAQ